MESLICRILYAVTFFLLGGLPHDHVLRVEAEQVGRSRSDSSAGAVLVHRLVTREQDVPGLSLLGSPIIVLGTLLAAVALNSLSITSINVKTDTLSVLTVSMALRLWNLAVICVAGVLLAVLGYAFLENFQVRSNS